MDYSFENGGELSPPSGSSLMEIGVIDAGSSGRSGSVATSVGMTSSSGAPISASPNAG